ncbi:MAG: acyltransferase family protein [bacterium]
MNRALSLYLDLARFTAAMIVFIGHEASMRLSGGLFWQINPYSDDAVIVFFTLSGFVIAYVTHTRETCLKSFASARLARLYSVILPALLLTFICDTIGQNFTPSLYSMDAGIAQTDHFLRYIASATFLNRSWLLGHLEPGTNLPFWSMSYEALYYMLFASIWFLRGWIRLVWAGLFIIIAGPTVMFLSIPWLIGFYAYKAITQLPVSIRIAWGLFIGSALILISSAWIRIAVTGIVIPFIDRDMPISDILDALAFAINVYAFSFIGMRFITPLNKLAPIIRWLGATTFALYLFHKPLLHFFAAIGPAEPSNLFRQILLTFGTLIVVFTLGHFFENQKSTLRIYIDRLLGVKRAQTSTTIPS